MTRQRRLILEKLNSVRTHPTAIEIYEMVRQRLPQVSLGTVYRNLEHLARTGDIQKLSVAGKEGRFDGNAGIHHHVRCISCGRVDDLDGFSVRDMAGRAEKNCNYKIVGYNLTFIGYCSRCKGKK